MTVYEEMFNHWERSLLLAQMRSAGGNQNEVARRLGLHRNTVRRRLIAQGVTDAEIQDAQANGAKLKLSRLRTGWDCPSAVK